MNSFSGKRALVVGGSGGIGAALSLQLAALGAKVMVHGGHESQKYAALMQKITALSPASASLVQLLSAEHFSQLADSPLARAAGDCDILCVCFGPFVQKPLAETTFNDWQTVSLLDYALPGFLVSAALPRMVKKKWGRILLCGGTGTAHRTEFKTNAAYAGAKCGLNVLVQSTAAAHAQDGITCNAVLPGFTRTEYAQDYDALARCMPLGTLLSPETVAESAVFLLSHAELNGVLLRVDGGWSPQSAGLEKTEKLRDNRE